MKTKSLLLWVTNLFFIGLAVSLALYKTVSMEVPFLPGQNLTNWTVEARVQMQAVGGRLKAEMTLPSFEHGGEVASLGFGYMERNRGREKIGVWSAAERTGEQVIYYQASARDSSWLASKELAGPKPPTEQKVLPDDGAEAVALKNLLVEAEARSADLETFVGQVQLLVEGEVLSQEAGILRRSYEKKYRGAWVQQLLMDLLAAKGVPVRRAWGVVLNEDLGQQTPIRMVDVYEGTRWRAFAVEANREPGPLAVWCRGEALLDITGGKSSEVYFYVTKSLVNPETASLLRDAPIWAPSIAMLPVSDRQVFRYIALIPVGAFVIVLLRNLVGLSMLGTFMPILLSLSFLEIPVVPALLMFALLLAVGLAFRFYLSRLNLLVVPRVAACVGIVSILMIIFALLSYRLGSNLGLKITAFPMVVMAWSIERMSLMWDEEGAWDAIQQVLGSILAAIVGYLVMRMPVVDYWSIYFPELLLILMAGILMVGRYTGYRLMELHRFNRFSPS